MKFRCVVSKMMKMKNVIISLIVIALIGFAYIWGYLCGKQEMALSAYEKSLMHLSNNILFYDAINANQTSAVKQLVVSSIESDFIQMTDLFAKYHFEQGQHVRCAASRRVRALKEGGDIFTSQTFAEEYPAEAIDAYLGSYCDGPPSHSNWLNSSADGVDKESKGSKE